VDVLDTVRDVRSMRPRVAFGDLVALLAARGGASPFIDAIR
jgi:hypothetical protein